MRALADEMPEPTAREAMLRLAAEYEHLAIRAAERAERQPEPAPL
jgi:hypothetical protein